MSDPFILPLEDCRDVALVGGKAAALGTLLRAGFRVPPGLCVTTGVYRLALEQAGIDAEQEWRRAGRSPERAARLDRLRSRIAMLSLPPRLHDAVWSALQSLSSHSSAAGIKPGRWAVRSSAVVEDAPGATYGGLYRTVLGVPSDRLSEAIAACWSSIWSDAAYAYAERVGVSAAPAMAVVIQPVLEPMAAGVGYSEHPVTGETGQIVINAVLGLGEPLVSGQLTPDEFIIDDRLVSRTVADKPFRMVLSDDGPGVLTQPLSDADRRHPALSDAAALELAALIRRVRATVGYPVDVEWAWEDGFWLLQARPIARRHDPSLDDLSEHDRHRFVWSRANFKETLLELPSPLALSFVRRFMDVNIVARYRSLGCRLPAGAVSVRVHLGRPYINVTLIQSFMAQLGGDPTLVVEQMGGEPLHGEAHSSSLPAPRLLLALVRLQAQIWLAALAAPRRFRTLAELAAEQGWAELERLDSRGMIRRMDRINERLERRDLTFAIVSGVSEALYALRATLARRLTSWRPCLNAAMQGLGTIISARQILWLQQLAETACEEPLVHRFLTAEPGAPSRFREQLAGTRFLASFERFLEEYGHRAIGESDVMSPRFAETPDYLLGIIRQHLQREPVRRGSGNTVTESQTATRRTALRTIHRALGWRLHERLWFAAWYRMLRHYLGLREANRHALMRYLAAARTMLLVLGRKLVERGDLDSPEDIFFLTLDEVRELATVSSQTAGPRWKRLVTARRTERLRNETREAPHTLHVSSAPEASATARHRLRGLPISSGVARGPVRRVPTLSRLSDVRPGEIIVAAVIDPGMAPVFGLAAGLVAEMGGLLSHGAIIAREYGLPTVANVTGATEALQDGELVLVDADRGEVIRLGQSDQGEPTRAQGP